VKSTGPKSAAPRRALLASFALIVGGAVSTFAALGTARAATIPDPVTNITVTPTNPHLSDQVRTDVQWCVPDSASAGDTFTIALPPELTQLPHGFGLRDPNGVLVANATITGTPAVATFTFNDYIDTHVNVCGTAFFESRLDSSLVAGQSYTLTYVVNGTTTFQPVITIQPGSNPTGRNVAKKGGFWGDPSDECRTAGADCLGWFVESRLGPLQSVTVTDSGSVDAQFDCTQLTVNLWSVDANGNLVQAFSPGSAGTTVNTTCSATGFQVVATNVPAARLLRVVVRATPNQLVPEGGVTYTNSASVTQVSSTGASNTDNVVGQRRSALVGGDANGVVPATTTTLAAATTTTLASEAPVPVPTVAQEAPAPQLPATGTTNTSLLYLGLAMLIGGGVLTVVSARRGYHRSANDAR
jgi:LPXTG-motif cell wall-anchored protein